MIAGVKVISEGSEQFLVSIVRLKISTQSLEKFREKCLVSDVVLPIQFLFRFKIWGVFRFFSKFLLTRPVQQVGFVFWSIYFVSEFRAWRVIADDNFYSEFRKGKHREPFDKLGNIPHQNCLTSFCCWCSNPCFIKRSPVKGSVFRFSVLLGVSCFWKIESL